MTTTKSKIPFEKSGFYFIGLLVLAFLGFWNSYFSKFFTGSNDYSFYFHFHATLMTVWVLLLITQPLLIRKRKWDLHRSIGKVTYFIMPLLLLSVLLLLHNRIKSIPVNEVAFIMILAPFRDFILLLVAFSIGVYYRHNIQIHARAMISTGIVFIEPALFRFLGGMLLKDMGITAAIVGIVLILALISSLIIIERKQKSGRWLFPSLLIVYSVVYSIMIFQIPLTSLDPFVRWFATLPLT